MTETVLVVDDDPDLCEQTVLSLEYGGYGAIGALGGHDALRQLHGGLRPCLILLDLMMPVMNGVEFHRPLNEEFPNAFTVAICSGDGDVARKAAAIGVADSLAKPYGTHDLLNLVQQVCGASKPTPSTTT